MKNSMNIIVRILLAGTFIISGIGKLISIHSFEAYVYSLNLFSPNLSIILSHLLIGVELILGSLFLFNLLQKQTWYFSIFLISGFTVFLLVQVFQQSGENCNCFGELITLSPIESLIKNLVIIVLLIWQKLQIKSEVIRKKTQYIVPIILIGLIIPFMINTPFRIFSKHKEFPIAEFSKQSEVIKNKFLSTSTFNLYEGKMVVCFYSLRCLYCRKAAEKLSRLACQYSFTDKVLVFFLGIEVNVEWFYKVANSERFSYRMMDKKEMSLITDGKVPYVLLLEEGIVKNTLRYEDITENELKQFFGIN
jgi:uncharacterized membrane protein YphA (DoxX/SURF4 family)